MLQLFCVLNTRICMTKSYCFHGLFQRYVLVHTVSWAVTVAATYCRCMYNQEDHEVCVLHKQNTVSCVLCCVFEHPIGLLQAHMNGIQLSSSLLRGTCLHALM